MNRIGVLANKRREGMGPAVDRFAGMAEGKGVDIVLEEGLRAVCREAHAFCPPDELPERSDVVVVMGGDGTILRAARLVRSTSTPILGVSLGRLAFLAGVSPEELEEGLGRLTAGEFEVEERMALEAEVGGETAFALNEIVIEKGVLARMVQVKTWISDARVSSCFGNGLIVATPTGSTGYSLSAGGPVLHPSVEALIITPICPHSLSLRPMVIPEDQSITVQVVAEHTDIAVTADGQTVTPLRPEQRVVVKRASRPVRFVNLQGITFYDLLRRKLDWSVDRREA